MSETIELHDACQEVAEISIRLKKAHYELYDLLQRRAPQIAEGKIEDPDLVDYYIICREIEQHADVMRKEARRGKRNAATQFCKSVTMKVVKALQKGDVQDDKISGNLGSARPKAATTMVMPEKGTEEHDAMLKELQVPEQAIRRGLVNPSFRGIQDHLTQLTSEGKKLPDFAKFTFHEYDMKATVKRSLRDKAF